MPLDFNLRAFLERLNAFWINYAIYLHVIVEDDGPGIPQSKRDIVFDRGQRADTLRPGQGVGLAVAREIVEQYDGQIITRDSLLGGAKMEVIFGHQDLEGHEG